jgi:hypothetical protein
VDLSAPIIYNSLTISGNTVTSGGAPMTGAAIDRINVSDIDVAAYLERRALTDGLNASDVYLGGRRVVIDAGVFGSTIAHGWDQLQAFQRAFHPRIAYNADTANLGFIAFKFRQPTTSTGIYAGGFIPLQLYLRPTRPVQYVVDRASTGGVGGKGIAFRAHAELVARDPRKYVQTATTLAITTSAQTVVTRGDYPTFGIVTWSQTATGAAAFQIVVNSASLSINLSAQSSGSWELHYANRTLKRGTTNLMSVLNSEAPAWPELSPGSVDTIYSSAQTGVSGLTLTHYDAYA